MISLLWDIKKCTGKAAILQTLWDSGFAFARPAAMDKLAQALAVLSVRRAEVGKGAAAAAPSIAMGIGSTCTL